MDGSTMRTLREYIHELRRRSGDYHRPTSESGFDTTIHEVTTGDQRDRGGDAGHDQHDQG